MSNQQAAEPPDDRTATPAIVMVASGPRAGSLVLPPPVALGRRIIAGSETHEVADERMSRDHATVRWDAGTWVIVDLESRNGTFVNGERSSGETRRRGDLVLRLGHTVFVLLADGRGHRSDTPPHDAVVGPELARVYDQIRRSAAGSTLLVQGESGSGKELAARLFHESSARRAGQFVAVNCAAIPDGVADRLIFGGKKGAAIETIGHVQMARGGTLLLDEVGDLDASAQASLLRLLAQPAELNIVAAGQDLRSAVELGQLQAELYAQLLRTSVVLPPLRARRVDIARQVQRDVTELGERAGLALGVHPKLLELCCIRPWPGNVRELQASVRQAAATAVKSGRDLVRAEDLAEHAGLPPGTASAETAVERPVPASHAALDKPTLVAAMQRANGVVRVAARALGLHRSQLYRLLDEHAIERGG